MKVQKSILLKREGVVRTTGFWEKSTLFCLGSSRFIWSFVFVNNRRVYPDSNDISVSGLMSSVAVRAEKERRRASMIASRVLRVALYSF